MVQSTYLRDSQRVREQAYRVSQARSRANPLLALRSGVRTHVGMRRKENQDAFGFVETEDFCFYAVADGMGGHLGGARAADLAVESIVTYLVEQPYVGLDDLREAVGQANEKIFQEGRTVITRAGMGTTLCGLLFKQTKLAVINVGDSRAYRLRDGVLTRLTRDHTLAAELRDGDLESDIPKSKKSSMSHILTRALGHSSYVDVDCDWYHERPQRGDVYIVCSDGLHGVLGRSEILSILQTHELRNAIEILVRCVNERGGPDNVTVLAVEVGSGFPPVLEEYSSSDRNEARARQQSELSSSDDGESQQPPYRVVGPHMKEESHQGEVTETSHDFTDDQCVSSATEEGVVKRKTLPEPMSIGFLLGVSVLFLIGLTTGVVVLYLFQSGELGLW